MTEPLQRARAGSAAPLPRRLLGDDVLLCRAATDPQGRPAPCHQLAPRYRGGGHTYQSSVGRGPAGCTVPEDVSCPSMSLGAGGDCGGPQQCQCWRPQRVPPQPRALLALGLPRAALGARRDGAGRAIAAVINGALAGADSSRCPRWR